MPPSLSPQGGSEPQTRKSHRKSRNGCLNCKRRRVKCDENKPCEACVRFALPCEYREVPKPALSATTVYPVSVSSSSQAAVGIPKRSRGRPRKNWAALSPHSGGAKSAEGSPARPGPAANPVSPAQSGDADETPPSALNVADAEFMHHFTTRTAYTLAGSEDRGDRIALFWAENVPKIGLKHHFVLHLAFAVAAFHVASLCPDETKRKEYLAQGDRHSSAGLARLISLLPHIDESNCGGVYVGATLVCYCAFAAGPTEAGDLLLFNDTREPPVHWFTLIRGIRQIRELIDNDVLFSGLMEPLGQPSQPKENDNTLDEPIMHRERYRPVDWEEPLRKLREFISERDDEDTTSCIQALDALSGIYEATYGKAGGINNVSAENQFIFGWLYRMDNSYITCLQKKYPPALVVLAYFASLLKVMERYWFMTGWVCLPRLQAMLRFWIPY